MSNVLVDRDKIDILANAISTKSGEPLKLTLDEMVEAVDGIETGGGTPTLETVTKTYTPSTSAVTDTITPSAGYDGIEEVDVTVSAVPLANPYFYYESQYATVSGNRKFQMRGAASVDNAEGDNEGYINEGNYHGNWYSYNAVPSGTTITPTTSSQTIGGTNYMMEGAVTVSAMPGGSVTAPASISGSSASVSTGTNTLTLSKTVSVTPNVTTAGYVSSGTAGNSNVSLTASVTTQGAQTLHPSTTDQTITGSKYLTGTQTFKAVTTSNLTADNIKSGVTVKIGDSTDDDCVASVTGTYSGGGGGGATIDVKTITPSSNVTSLSFDVSGKPIMFVVQMNKNNSYINGSSTRYITSAANNGETVYTTALYKSGSTGREYTYNTSSWSYSNGTLTVTSGGGSTAGYFTTSQYRLIYAY